MNLLSIPYGFLSRLAGIIDGDGYISIVKSDKERGYCVINLKIGLLQRDLDMLINIKKVLGIGRIAGPFKNTIKDGMDIYHLIFNRTDLQQVLFPLLIHHNIFFLTETRRIQFERAIFVMLSGITNMNEIPSIIPKTGILPKLPITSQGYLKLPFFKGWIVGFTISEGSFFIKMNLDACFELRQRTHYDLFEAFKLLFETTKKIGNEKGKYAKFSVSSKADIQNVINFFSFSDNPSLLGYKLEQSAQNLWLANLRLSKRYSHLNFPK